MSKLKKSCVLTLFDTPKNRKKLVVLGKLETAFDDVENGIEVSEFCSSLDEELEFGKSYKITIEEV